MMVIYLKLIWIIRINQNLKILDGKLVLEVYSYFLIVFFMTNYKQVKLFLKENKADDLFYPICPASALGSIKAAGQVAGVQQTPEQKTETASGLIPVVWITRMINERKRWICYPTNSNQLVRVPFFIRLKHLK